MSSSNSCAEQLFILRVVGHKECEFRKPDRKFKIPLLIPTAVYKLGKWSPNLQSYANMQTRGSHGIKRDGREEVRLGREGLVDASGEGGDRWKGQPEKSMDGLFVDQSA